VDILLKTQEIILKKEKGEDAEMSSLQMEEEITKILTSPKLATIKAMLEKDHAIDCLFLLLMGKGRWKDAKAFMNKHKLTLSDGTFRARMIEIEHLGLAKSTQIDPLKKYYTITSKGEEIAKLMLQLLQKI
jgi:DNA-binding HxlR family transcriptional regulator